MKLKKYLNFIKESIKEDIEEQSIWKVTEDEIQDYLRDLDDEQREVENVLKICRFRTFNLVTFFTHQINRSTNCSNK